jgi:AraC-like DNA-binding protein
MVSDPNITAAQPDHTLGQYRAWRLSGGAVAPFDLAWISIARDQSPAAHRLLPHGEPSIAVMRKRDADGEINDVSLKVCGPYYKTDHYRPKPREELIALRLKPEICAALFNIAPREYANDATTQAPAALYNACAKTLDHAASASTADILLLLTSDLSRFVASHGVNTGPETIAAQWMRDMEGSIQFRHIAQKLEVSERNLRRRFTDHVGCSPKAYARRLQITAASLAAERSAKPDWAAISAEAGFHDQPHMINVFKTEIGLTPSALHAERRALLAA